MIAFVAPHRARAPHAAPGGRAGLSLAGPGDADDDNEVRLAGPGDDDDDDDETPIGDPPDDDGDDGWEDEDEDDEDEDPLQASRYCTAASP